MQNFNKIDRQKTSFFHLKICCIVYDAYTVKYVNTRYENLSSPIFSPA